MFGNFEDVQKLAKSNMENAAKNFGAVSKGMQVIALEQADYSKKAIEAGAAQFEKAAGAKSLDALFEVQADFLKTSYETAVAQTTKIGEMYADLAKDAYKPFEAAAAKSAK